MHFESPKRVAALVALLILIPGAPALARVDGSKPFLCAVTEAVDCGSDGTCSRGSAEAVGLPTFVWVDVPGAQLREHRGERTTKIGRKEQRDGRLLLQGVEKRAWSISINESTGELTAAAAGDGAGFVLFGACTLP
jgi:hypothetical protein